MSPSTFNLINKITLSKKIDKTCKSKLFNNWFSTYTDLQLQTLQPVENGMTVEEHNKKKHDSCVG